MWGGKREGAGRKSLETVRVRVPVAVLDQVNDIIKQHKAGYLKVQPKSKALKANPEIKALKADPEIKKLEIKDLKGDPEIKDHEIKDLKADPEINKAFKDLQGLKPRVVKQLRKAFGTLFIAAKLGVRAQADGGFFVPYVHQYRLSPSCQ